MDRPGVSKNYTYHKEFCSALVLLEVIHKTFDLRKGAHTFLLLFFWSSAVAFFFLQKNGLVF